MSRDKQINYKEFAREMRENCCKDSDGNIVCTSELWELIASTIEGVREYRNPSEFAEEIFEEVLSVVDKRIAEIEERYQRTSWYPTHPEYGFICFLRNYFKEIKTELAELKKKYTEGT